jgi:DNA-binding transcriptional ArsR family regulator
MKGAAVLGRDTAKTYAEWFRTLADPTRVQILNLLAETGNPMTVGEIVEQVSVGQSTVSAHL